MPSYALIAAAWGPDSVVSTPRLDSQLWRLRNILEPTRDRASSVLVKSGAGYRLAVGSDEVDSARFLRMSHDLTGAPDSEPGERDTIASLDEALGLWRGRPSSRSPTSRRSYRW